MNKPDSIVWLITSRCNLNCPYCYATLYNNERELPISDIRRIIKDAYENGINYINITGGEPLLRRDIVDIAKQIKEYGIETSVFSNLTLLNKDIAYELSKYINYFLTTIDGPREIYEYVKGVGLWNRLIDNVNLLKQLGVDIHINIPVSKLNYSRIGEAVEAAIERGVYSISIIPTIATGRAVETNVFITKNEYLEALIQVSNTAEKYGLTITAWCSPFAGIVRSLRNIRYGNCRFWNVVDITPSGNIVLCDVTGLVIGNIIMDGLADSWRKLCEFKKLIRINEIPADCRKCWLSSDCIGGCYARSYLTYREFNKTDPLCPGTSSTKYLTQQL